MSTINSGIEFTLEKTAVVFGVDQRTVRKWLDQGCPGRKDSHGHWVLNSAETTAWLKGRERVAALGEVCSLDIQEARKRKIAAEARIAEVAAAEREGAVVAIADFEASLAAMIGAARAKLLNLGSKLGPLMPQCETAAEAKDTIDAAVLEVLAELSTGGEGLADEPTTEVTIHGNRTE